ncbi:MAG TPA: VOC family protein [Frankiaceae bacterium]|nr:VOC family protein [Frankiaceae bacterium]
MDQTASFITFATADLDAARAFYSGGLGWTPILDVPGEIIFFQVGHGLTLGLFEAAHFSADLGDSGAPPVPIQGITLSQNVNGPADVDAVVAAAEAAGATVVKAPQFAAFGGYHGHFRDPNGIIWEIAHNPGWRVEADGRVRLDAPSDA